MILKTRRFASFVIYSGSGLGPVGRSLKFDAQISSPINARNVSNCQVAVRCKERHRDMEGRDSSVGIATRYGPGGPGIESQ